MKLLEAMGKYGIEIEEEDGKYLLRFHTGDLIDSLESRYITKEEADKLSTAYKALDGLDLYHSEDGKRAAKYASAQLSEIVFAYRNRERGLIKG